MATPENDAYQAKSPLVFRPTAVSPAPGGAGADGDYGDITISGGGSVVSIDAGAVGTTELADDCVTLAKIQELSANRVLGTSTSGNPTQLRVDGNIIIDGGVLGLANGDKGDITISSVGGTLSINPGAVDASMTSITGTPDGSKYLRDDWSWQTVSGGSGLTSPQVLARGLGA